MNSIIWVIIIIVVLVILYFVFRNWFDNRQTSSPVKAAGPPTPSPYQQVPVQHPLYPTPALEQTQSLAAPIIATTGATVPTTATVPITASLPSTAEPLPGPTEGAYFPALSETALTCPTGDTKTKMVEDTINNIRRLSACL